MKDAKAFINNYDLIQYYLHIPEFFTGWADDALITDLPNLEASQMWEGQRRLSVKDGSLCYLLENKVDQFNGRGFKMLAALTHHCRPDSVANAFTSLLSLFNNVQGNDKSILQYWSHFDGIIMDLSQCKVAIPQILLIMLFLWALHSRYFNLLEQFCTRFKSIEHATTDSIIDDVMYHIVPPSMNARELSLLHLLLVCRLPLAPTQIRRAIFGKRHLNGCQSPLARNQSRLDELVHSREQASALSAAARTSPGTSLPIALCSRNSI
jgi:hypothetical protein